MVKLIVVVMLGLLLAGCTIPSLSDLPKREEGSLIVVCPSGKVMLNTGGKACTEFMKLDEKPEF